MSIKLKKNKEFLNKKAFHDYYIDNIIEVGIELQGSEVKAIREGRLNLKDSFVRIIKNELFILNMHITHLETTHNTYRPDEKRSRKLLAHRKEIDKFFKHVSQDGYTLIATKLYFNTKNFVKLNIGLGKGKKLYDKRADLKEKDTKMETMRILKAWGK